MLKKLFSQLEKLKDKGRRVYAVFTSAEVESPHQNDVKKYFLTNISHEMRTPLGAILGFTELTLSEGDLTDAQSRNLKVIAKNGLKLRRVIDDILELSQLEDDSLSLENESFSLVSLLDEVNQYLNLRASEKSLALSFVNETALPNTVLGDRRRIKQVLVRVIENAIRFTEKGKVEVRGSFTLDQLDNHIGRLKLNVIDNGIGISRDDERFLFKVFSQADSTLRRRFGGLGAGLYASRQFCRRMGGDLILVRSSIESGSEFEITLQLSVTDFAEQIEKLDFSSPTQDRVEVPALLKNAQILVVDDSMDNLILLSAYLKKLGQQAHVVDSGLGAIQMFSKIEANLVIMDLQMPEMDGFEATAKLRALGYKGPILAMTAHAKRGDREHCLKLGFDGFLPKPISIQSIRESLRSFLQADTSVTEVLPLNLDWPLSVDGPI